MARRGNPTLDTLRGRIKSIVRYKPQLPPARGPFTRVRFYGLNTSHTKVGQVQPLGDLVLRDGRIVADPPDVPALLFALNEPVRIENAQGRMVTFDSKWHPKQFLKALPKAYGHGSYFWCEAIKD
jgi:hypothetical protein